MDIKNCKTCKEIFYPKVAKQNFCCHKCYWEDLKNTGKNNNRLLSYINIPTIVNNRFKKGHIGYKSWLGKKMSREHIDKAIKTKSLNPTRYWLGKKRPEIGRLVGDKLKGRKLSPERREQLSRSVAKGKDHKWWKGGVTIFSRTIRHCVKYKLWRSAVFERDNWTCVSCGSRGVYLHADHIYPFSFIIRDFNIKKLHDAMKCDALWDLSNGRTLCVPCHKATETYMNKIKKYKHEKTINK